MITLKAVEIKPNVYWVGAIDWDLQNFHGYLTQRGSTYNAYLIVDEKITLIDTVKHYKYDEMLSRINDIIDPKKIEYIISNHVEMDHSGCLPKLHNEAPNATIITSTRGEKGLKKHYTENLPLKAVDSKETFSIGKRTLTFVHVPMVHWPDSMVTYSKHDSILFSNDAFGQHLATTKRFDDEVGWDIVKEEATKYYANIVMLYGDQVNKALQTLQNLKIDVIAPSHGIIWRSYLQEILSEYQKWATYQSDKEAVIVYDTMWNSTKKLAIKLQEGLQEAGIPTTLRNLTTYHASTVITDVLTKKLVCIGSPTLNNGMLPTVGGFLTYLTGLRPKNKTGFAFGSYGWGGQALKQIQQVMQDLNWNLPIEGVNINCVPTKQDLENIKEIGKKIGKNIQ